MYTPTDYTTSGGSVELAANWGLSPSITINHPGPAGTATFPSAFGGVWVENSTWTLYVRDDASGDVGSLGSWGFTINYNIIVKTDDFNGDQNGDILWRNDSGQVYFWNMNGTAINSEGAAAHAPVPPPTGTSRAPATSTPIIAATFCGATTAVRLTSGR